MKLIDKINGKKALIVFPIVIVLVGSTLIGAFSPLFMDNFEANSASNMVGKDLSDAIGDERALKILDIHENLPNYLDKEVTLEGYFINYDKNTKIFGVEVPLENGEITMTSLMYELEDSSLLDNINDTSLVKASGTISSFEQVHEDEEQGDHTHTLPKFHVKKIDVVR